MMASKVPQQPSQAITAHQSPQRRGKTGREDRVRYKKGVEAKRGRRRPRNNGAREGEAGNVGAGGDGVGHLRSAPPHRNKMIRRQDSDITLLQFM